MIDMRRRPISSEQKRSNLKAFWAIIIMIGAVAFMAATKDETDAYVRVKMHEKYGTQLRPHDIKRPAFGPRSGE